MSTRSLRSRKWLVLGFLASSAVLVGCPGKDPQRLTGALSDVKAVTADEGHNEVASAAAEGTADGEDANWLNYSTGTPGWGKETGGRISGVEMTFGPGHAGPADARWAFNTDSTGAVGDKLGTGVSYGASSGVLVTVPGTQATRADNYPTVQAQSAQAPSKKTR